MATTTTNNGWQIPQSSDLVTNGATAIATLGSGIDTSVGTGLLAWTAFTPTATGWTVNNGTWNSYYVQLGKTVIWRCKFTVGSSTSITGALGLNLPVTAKVGGNYEFPHTVMVLSATNAYTGVGWLQTTTSWAWAVSNAAGTYTSTTTPTNIIPNNWTVGNTINFTVVYEAA